MGFGSYDESEQETGSENKEVEGEDRTEEVRGENCDAEGEDRVTNDVNEMLDHL
jgi:hypothetical protein